MRCQRVLLTAIAESTLTLGFLQEYPPFGQRLLPRCFQSKPSRLLASIESHQATGNDPQDAYGEGS
jgi:hypothetical protein